jgi:hypothetical protein
MPPGPGNRQLWSVPVGTGAEQSLLETMVYRPPGAGPFPLVTINHGKPRPGDSDPSAMHPGFGAAAHWFVDRSFAVAVPMRRGYGLSPGPISDTPALAATAITLPPLSSRARSRGESFIYARGAALRCRQLS